MSCGNEMRAYLVAKTVYYKYYVFLSCKLLLYRATSALVLYEYSVTLHSQMQLLS